MRNDKNIKPDLETVPGVVPPKGMTSGLVTTSDNMQLRYALSARQSSGRGTVCIFQGRAEYIEKYYETILDLQEQGFSVALLDWRGQGHSERLLKRSNAGHIRNYAQYDLDINAFMTKVVLPDCPPPYYALGHSTGSTILLRSLQNRNWFSGAVLASPFLGIYGYTPTPIISFLAASATYLGFGRMKIPGFNSDDDFSSNRLTHDEHRFALQERLLKEFPDLKIGAPSFNWIHASLDAQNKLLELRGPELLRCPAIIIASGDERLVDLEAEHLFARNMQDVPIVVVENAAHELMNERDEFREQFWAAFYSFIEGLEQA